MQRSISIIFRNMDPSPAVEDRIREHAAKLEHLFHRIISCQVTVDVTGDRHHKGKLYRVGVIVRIPTGEISVRGPGPKNHAHEDIYVAVRDAFDAIARRLEDRARRMRGDVKAHETSPHGTVTKILPAKGYGFIQTSEGEEIYFHRNSVSGGAFDALTAGSKVRLSIAEGESEHGAQASSVVPIGKHHLRS